jgi:lipoic acid synthetase
MASSTRSAIDRGELRRFHRPNPHSPYNESLTELVQISPARKPPAPKPEWLKARAPVGENYHSLKQLARSLRLNTVCESAHCPNIGECWQARTATFLLLGNICTRHCGFCAVPKGRPEPIDFDEPRRVAQAVSALGLEFAVLTSVDRDDDLPGGARAFAMVIEEIRRQAPNCRVEVLIPDFQGSRDAVRTSKPVQMCSTTIPRRFRASTAWLVPARAMSALSNCCAIPRS